MDLALKLFFGCCLVGICAAKSELEIKKYFMELGLECTKEISISPDDMMLLHKHEVPDNEQSKCFLACVYRKVKWIDSKGMFDVDAANAMTDKEHTDEPDKIEKSKKLFDICKAVNDETVSDGEKGCERSAALLKCLVGNAPKVGLELVI